MKFLNRIWKWVASVREPKIKAGSYWHVHHDTLMEWCHDYDERLTYIKRYKPASEQELRIKLFRPVKGQLPSEFIETAVAYNKAGIAHNKAIATHNKVKYNNKTEMACDKTRTAYCEAGRAYDRMCLVYKEEIETLHKKECPNCPWDGVSIFKVSSSV